MTTPGLRFSNVEIFAEGQRLLGPVDLNLTSPGITVILGPNGAGKSLFLAAAHGLIAPKSGQITWDGVPAAQSRKNRGFVFQNSPVLRRSVAGNIALPLDARALPRATKKRLIEQALKEADLWAAARQPAAALSGGERSRLALARAMVTAPKVLFLDEPAANLDPDYTADLEKRLRDIAANGTKILMSTHDLAAARRLADDILFFAAGQLVEQARADAFFAAPQDQTARGFLKGRL